ncbi:MAG: CsbD family protein [Fibrobacterota bacterium]|nr:CsbD family protein [Chitinispirillaceae bacterium]
MKSSTKDTTKGMLHQLTGNAKVITGKVIKSPGLEAEGNVEIAAGKIQKKTAQVKKLIEK